MARARRPVVHPKSTAKGRARSKPRARPTTWATVVRIARALPGVEEGMAYGTPAIRVAGRFLGRLREDGVLAIRCGFEDRALLMDAHPSVFYFTDHYANYPAVLIRLANVRSDVLREVIERAWRRTAPKRVVEAYDERVG